MAENNPTKVAAQCSEKLSCYIKKILNKIVGEPKQKIIVPTPKEEQQSDTTGK